VTTSASGRYSGPLGRLFELTDIAIRFDKHRTRMPDASPERHQQLAGDFDRVWAARKQEWERLRAAGMPDREIYQRVRDHWTPPRGKGRSR
jgi:hypothetical protein